MCTRRECPTWSGPTTSSQPHLSPWRDTGTASGTGATASLRQPEGSPSKLKPWSATRAGGTRWIEVPSRSQSRIYPQRPCSTCWEAGTARRIVSLTSPGTSLDQLRWAGLACRRSVTTCTIISPSATSTRATRTAAEALEEERGVCRDYAHLALTFCRCLNIPARYCTGYISDIGLPPPHAPQDFAAWIEVYLGGRWHTFDPRNNDPRIGRILIARGRDAADVPLTLTFGPNTLISFKVMTEEVPA